MPKQNDNPLILFDGKTGKKPSSVASSSRRGDAVEASFNDVGRKYVKTVSEEAILRKKKEEIIRRIKLYKGDKHLDEFVEKYTNCDFLRTEENFDKILCFHWNCCGICKQTVSANSNDCCLLDLIIIFEPDVILLNELKANKDNIIAVVRGLDGYACSYIPSTAPNGRSMRGSAIIYNNRGFTVEDVDAKSFTSEGEEAPDIEAIAVDIKINSTAKKYRLICSYVTKDKHFEKAAVIYKELSSASTRVPTIVAGDLNMEKEKFAKKWNDEGFKDSMNPSCKTNKKGNSLTSIDWVMHNRKKSPVFSHRPIQPDNDSVHFVVPFTLGNEATGYCTDPQCLFKCGEETPEPSSEESSPEPSTSSRKQTRKSAK